MLVRPRLHARPRGHPRPPRAGRQPGAGPGGLTDARTDLFPGQAVVVSDARQTEEFFAASWAQYDGVAEAEPHVTVMGEAPGTMWLDVTWPYDGQEHERFCYQLVERPAGHQIAVLTLMG